MNQHERLSDELLVLRSQEGDAGAFEALVGRWQERLWRHAWRLAGNESVAWDMLQETWIGISRGLGRLADPAAFPAWAYRIISHKCHDWDRRESRRRKAARGYLEHLQQQEPQAAVAENEFATLKDALESLCGPDRALLSLRYEERFHTAEIALILGVPEGTVKSRLFYARKRLRKFLEIRDE
jgi:RNA polymerase sigma-70 factor (ECF subfamily)